MEWISIIERVPEKNEEVLACAEGDEWVTICVRRTKHWYNAWDFNDAGQGACPCYPTHWMPLPKPPKE